MEIYLGVNGNRFQRQYKEKLSNYRTWEQSEHAEEYLYYPENMGQYLSIDEVALSNGELYTVLTNKLAKEHKGAIVGMFKGTKAEDIIKIIKDKFPDNKRYNVLEITLDMAHSMNLIAKKCFPKAERITDRFHVQKLVSEAVQSIRVKYRWEALEKENLAIKEAKKKGITYIPEELENGDTHKQLLARSRYLLFKPRNRWTESQTARAETLFKHYPDIEKAYIMYEQLGHIYNKNYHPNIARVKLAQWHNMLEESSFDAFRTITKTFEMHNQAIINFFSSRNTNASAESFNAKIKDFRRQFRGVADVKFFLFRLTNIYA